jgi:hypothetical protein
LWAKNFWNVLEALVSYEVNRKSFD